MIKLSIKKIFLKIIITLVVALTFIPLPGASIYAAGSDNQATNTQSTEIVVEINGTVSKEISKDNLYFISGDFSSAKVDNGARTNRNNMIVLDLEKRALSDWIINTDAPVFDMAVANNTLLIGGSFSNINGTERQNIAGYNIGNQQLINNLVGANGAVNSLEAYNDDIFISGGFTVFNNLPRLRLASWDSVNQKVNAWNPRVNNTIYDSLVYKDRLYIVGEFTKVNEIDRKYVASFALPEGKLTSWSPNVDFPIRQISMDGENIVLQEYNGARAQVEFDTTAPIVATTDTVTSSTTETATVEGLMIDREKLGFTPPTLSDVLTFAVRAFFVVGGLAALFYLLRGALSWITSGGDKDSVGEARNQIQAAIIGLIMIVAVLAIIWTLEQVVFSRRICIGLSCPLTIPSLIEPLN